MFSRLDLISIIVILILSFKENGLAHPNTIINYRIFFKFDGYKVTDIGQSWSFDKITSYQLMLEYDIAKKNKLNEKESKAIAKKIIQGLWEVRYFTYISVNNQDSGRLKTSGFKAQINGDILTLAFNTHLSLPVDARRKHLSVEIKDPDLTIITSIAQKKPAILIGKPKGCSVNIKEKKLEGLAKEYYSFGMFVSQKEVSVSCDKNQLKNKKVKRN